MRIKKFVLIVAVVAVLATSRIYEIASWLQRYDLVYNAREFERTYLTGTTIAVLVVLAILLRSDDRHWFR